jgi:anti-sigma regulatory factor (Ser/Thr protein kinase)
MTYWYDATRLPAEALSAARARDFVRHNLVDRDLLSLLEPVRLAASELATNAILHARTDFTVTLTGLQTKVLLAVEDAAEDDLPSLRHEGTPRAVVMSIGGRGLGLVSHVRQECGVTSNRPGFKTVWASFPRQPA